MPNFSQEELLILRLKYYGTTKGESFIIVPDELITPQQIITPAISEKNVVRYALNFYREFFSGINETVRYVPMNISDIDTFERKEISNPSADVLIDKINKHTTIMSYSDFVTQKLLRDSISENMGATIVTPILHENDYYLKKVPITHTGIVVGTENNKKTTGILIHEIAHVLIDRNKGIYTNYNNAEVISVFLELVYYYHSCREILSDEIASFIYYPIKNIPENAELDPVLDEEIIKTATSYPKAIALFEKYSTSDESIQKEMLNGVANIFNGEITVEEFLENYDINKITSYEAIINYSSTIN